MWKKKIKKICEETSHSCFQIELFWNLLFMISSYYIYFCAEKLWEIKKLKKEEATTINSKKYQPPHSPTPQIVTNIM